MEPIFYEAPRLRRAGAWIVDLAVTAALAGACLGAAAYFVPPDRKPAFLICLSIGLALGSGYLLLAPALRNSLGKTIFSLQAVATQPGETPTIGRWLARGLVTAAIWPVNAVLVLLGHPRHLGDRVGKTRVVLAAARRHGLLATALAAVLVVACYQAMSFAVRFSAINTDAWKTARSAVSGGSSSSLPAAFAIRNDQAVFYFEGTTGHHGVSLARRDGRWTVVESKSLTRDEVPNEASISFSTSADDAVRSEIQRVIHAKLSERTAIRAVRCPQGALVGTFQCVVERDQGGDVTLDVTRKGEDLTFKPAR